MAEQHYGEKEPDVAPPAPSDDWERMPPPKPGEWLYDFPETGQTLAEYKRQLTNRRTSSRNRLRILPLGDLAEEQAGLLEDTVGYFRAFFQCPVEAAQQRPLPGACLDRSRDQYDAACALERAIIPEIRPQGGTLALLGLTDRDLYHGRLNFVFGVGSPADRVGLYSVHRFSGAALAGRDKPRLVLERTLKTSSHEVGHILGMAHCTFYRCLMNGSNSLAESDRRLLFLCPVCLAKLEYNLKFERAERYRQMGDYFAERGMKQQAAFCRRRIRELGDPGSAEFRA